MRPAPPRVPCERAQVPCPPCSQISDFIIVGVAEFASDEQGFGLETANKALLDSYHNPRRAMLQKVVLTSDYKGCTDFITGVSGPTFCSKELTAADVAGAASDSQST